MIEIFADRGYSSIYPENTLLACNRAFESGAHGVSVEVRMTADEELVLMADPSVDRTTDGSGPVATLKLNEIFQLDAGSWKGIAYENEPVPTLASLFGSMPADRKVILNTFDDKNYREQIFFTKLSELVTQFQMQQAVICASASYRQLALAKQHLPGILCALAPAGGLKGLLARHLLRHSVNVDGLHLPANSISAGLVKGEHLCNRTVRGKAAVDSYQLLQLQKAGVDGIIIADPTLGLVYSD